jgi:phage terminase small subunit
MLKKTKEEKELQGTFEPSREDTAPVSYQEYERVPRAPTGWPPQAQKVFQDRCEDLKQAGYLKRANITALRRYCFAIYQAELAEKMLLEGGEYNSFVETQIGTEGQEYQKMSTWLQVLDNANRWIEKLGSKFGFTPYDAAKIPKVTKETPPMSLLK